MRRTTPILLLPGLACGSPTPVDPTDTDIPGCFDGSGGIKLSQDPAHIDDQLVDDALLFGTPPQGGAPYAPLYVRMQGLSAAQSVHFEITCSDLDDAEVLGISTYDQPMLCANAGPYARWVVGPSLHLRFGTADAPISLESLDGRRAELSLSATVDDQTLEFTQEVHLRPLP
jgi:hypothetical protein